MDAEKFLAIELKYNLNRLNVKGVDYWNHSRFDIWTNYICQESLSLGKSNGNYSINIVSYIKRLKYMITKPYRVDNCEILFLNHPRRIKNGCYYDCPYTEDLNKLYNSVTIEDEFHQMHFTPTNTPNLMYADKYTILASIYSRIMRLYKRDYKKVYNQVKTQLQKAINELNEEYNCQIDIDKVAKKITKNIYCIKCISFFLSKIVKRLHPKLIVEVVHYRTINMIINEIAKRYGITTIELQHGLIYSYHIPYQYAKGVKINQFPDKIYLFSDYWKATIRAPIEVDALISVGYPYFEKNLHAYSSKKENSDKYTILFISQGTIGRQLSEFAIRLVKLIGTDKYRFIYKLHPSEYSNWSSLYPSLNCKDVDVIDNNEKSIYYYFSLSDMQIGVYSTAIYEGLAFSLKTIILRVGQYDIMESLVSNGYAFYVDNEFEAKDIIFNNMKKCVETKEFWKKNAFENIVNEINKELTLAKIK